MGGQRHARAAFTPEKKTGYSLHKRLCGPQARSGRIGNIAPTGIRSPDRQALSESLQCLRHPGPLMSSTRGVCSCPSFRLHEIRLYIPILSHSCRNKIIASDNACVQVAGDVECTGSP